MYFLCMERLGGFAYPVASRQFQPSESISIMTDSDTDDGDASGYPDPDSVSADIRLCEPPIREPTAIDLNERWEDLATDRYERAKCYESLSIHADAPGIGKTTNLARGAAEYDDPFVLYLPKHQNCHEFKTADSNDPKPSVDLHLKGPDQPVADECLEAKHTDTPCDDHPNSACPTMCPVFSKADEELRKRFEAVRADRGTAEAHKALELEEKDWHPDKCEWQQQWEQIDEVDRIVTVSNYLTEERVNQVGINIVDDVQGFLGEKETLTEHDLRRVVGGLEPLAEMSALSDAVNEIISFIEQLQEILTTDDPDGLSSLSPPVIDTSEGWIEGRLPEGTGRVAEILAWVRHAYREQLLLKTERIEGGIRTHTYYEPDDETPFHLDAVFIAAAKAGLPSESVRHAIGTHPGIEQCPRCGETSAYGKGEIEEIPLKQSGTLTRQIGAYYHRCQECGWSEAEDSLTAEVEEVPRATRWIQTDIPDKLAPQHELVYRELPLTTDLPDPSDTMILDATPVPDAYALLFGLDLDEVEVLGDEPVELNATVTQIIDGQYHRGTITDNSDRGENLRSRLQRSIDQIADQHDQIIIAGHKKAKGYFEIPQNAEWLSFHAARGLDRPKYDAVVVVGAPHTHPRDFHEDATLLAIDRDEVRVGGIEHAPRDDDDVRPPIFRKYYYEDNEGKGRAVPTKHYTGLVGKLFRNRREHEILQLAHRHRPAIADDIKGLYLLTNVPTRLPIDNLVTLSELSEAPAKQVSGLTDTDCSFAGAMNLLEISCNVATTERPGVKDRWFRDWDGDSFTATTGDLHDLVTEVDDGMDVSKRAVNDYLDQLTKIGVVEQKEDYIQREGYPYQFDTPTSQKALYLLNNSDFCEVGPVRRLVKKVENAEGTTEWLEWAEDQFDLSEDSQKLSQM